MKLSLTCCPIGQASFDLHHASKNWLSAFCVETEEQGTQLLTSKSGARSDKQSTSKVEECSQSKVYLQYSQEEVITYPIELQETPG